MEWVSDKVMNGYHLVNKLVYSAAKKKYPALKYFKISEESFNNLFQPDREPWKVPSVDVILCVDFSEDYSKDNSNIGVEVMNLMYNSTKSVFMDSRLFDNFSYLITDKFYLNKTEYCKGIIHHTVE